MTEVRHRAWSICKVLSFLYIILQSFQCSIRSVTQESPALSQFSTIPPSHAASPVGERKTAFADPRVP